MTRQTKITLLLLTTAVIFTTVAVVDSALVTRPTKTCGNTTYVDEIADGCTTILAAEVDADLDEIITAGVNNIDTANLEDDAVTTDKIADDAVVAAKILNGEVAQAKIANSAVNSAKIADGTIVPVDLAVNATQNNFTSKAAELGASITTPAFWVQPTATITTRGGRVLIMGNVAGFALLSTTETLTIRIRRDATTAVNGTEIARVDYLVGSATTSAGEAYPVPFPFFVDVPSAAGHTYSVTVEISGGTFNTDASDAGTMFVMELS